MDEFNFQRRERKDCVLGLFNPNFISACFSLFERCSWILMDYADAEILRGEEADTMAKWRVEFLPGTSKPEVDVRFLRCNVKYRSSERRHCPPRRPPPTSRGKTLTNRRSTSTRIASYLEDSFEPRSTGRTIGIWRSVLSGLLLPFLAESFYH